MSKGRRVAGVVCEGRSDFPILRQIIFSLYPEVGRVLCLQPELDEISDAPRDRSGGWSSVRAFCERHRGSLDFLLSTQAGSPLDLLIVTTDVDIAIHAGIIDHPTHLTAYATPRLCDVVKGWLLAPGKKKLPPAIVIGLPAMAIESWVIAALYPRQASPEAFPDPAEFLAMKGKLARKAAEAERGKPWKDPALYAKKLAPEVGRRLDRVRGACPEADRLCQKISNRRLAVEGG